MTEPVERKGPCIGGVNDGLTRGEASSSRHGRGISAPRAIRESWLLKARAETSIREHHRRPARLALAKAPAHDDESRQGRCGWSRPADD